MSGGAGVGLSNAVESLVLGISKVDGKEKLEEIVPCFLPRIFGELSTLVTYRGGQASV